MQRLVRRFLAVKQAQLEVVTLQFDSKAELYKKTHKYCAAWLGLPMSVKHAIVWGDIKFRRRLHERELSEEEKMEAALDEAWNLLHGSTKDNIVSFNVLPKEEHVLEVMQGCIKQLHNRGHE